ncbi:MAG: M50 family metallopeptidase [Candidatus Saccharimonadia bacterium]
MILTLILVIVIFGCLVFVHEFGHFLVAKKSGVEVEEFGFGFPPRIVGRKVGKTVYSLNWLPLGGFVRLYGEDSSDTRPKTFGAASIGVKTAILLAGVVMNLILAYLIVLVLCFTGLPAVFTSGFVLPKPVSSTPKQVMVVDVGSGTPAATAGIVRGDIILSGGSQEFTDENQLIAFTKSHAGETVDFSVLHGGKKVQDQISLRSKKAGATSGYLGVTPLQVYSLYYGLSSFWVAGSLSAQVVWATLAGVILLFIHLPALIVGLFQPGIPQAAAGVAGPIGIFTLIQSITALGWNYLMFLVMTISVALAVFNVLPIPVLDGGKLFLIWLQKLLNRTFSPRTEARIYTASFAVLGLLIIMISIFDIRRL